MWSVRWCGVMCNDVLWGGRGRCGVVVVRCRVVGDDVWGGGGKGRVGEVRVCGPLI